MRFKCNTCGGTYSDTQVDGTAYFHVCPAEEIQHAVFDVQTDKLLNAEKRTARASIRDERPAPTVVLVDGKPHRYVPHPEERGTTLVPADFAIVSEGKGRTLVPEDNEAA